MKRLTDLALALTVSALVLPTAAFAYTFDKDVPQDIQKQTIADLNFVTTIKSDTASPLHQQIYGKVDGGDYDKFFNSHIDGIGLDDCGDGKAVACVIPFMGKKMWLTQNYIKFSHPQIARLMVIFHEARHTEGEHGNWAHADCPEPFLGSDGKDITSIWTGATLAGEPACDVTPLGSYGSSSIMLKNISRYCTNCSDKVKMDAGIYADDQYKRIIDDGAKQAMLNDVWKR